MRSGDQGKPGEPGHRNIGRGSCRSALADGVGRLLETTTARSAHRGVCGDRHIDARAATAAAAHVDIITSRLVDHHFDLVLDAYPRRDTLYTRLSASWDDLPTDTPIEVLHPDDVGHIWHDRMQ